MKIFLLIFLCVLSLVEAQTANEYCKCNSAITFTSTSQTLYIYWPSQGDALSCTYLIKSPVNTYIRATVYHNLAGTEPSCSANEGAWVSRDADYNFRGASLYCGNRMKAPLQINSIGNELTLAVQSLTTTGRAFQVVLNAIALNENNCDCSWNVNTRIIGGTNAKPNEFVGHVGFKTNYGTGFEEQVCGGTIVTANYIVSAAHCIYAFQNNYDWKILAHVGRHDITKAIDSDTIYAAAYSISQAIVHNGYNSETNANDIALVKTSTYIKFNRGVGPACLPYAYRSYAVPSGTELTAIGWGATEFSLSASADKKSWILQKVSLFSDANMGACKTDATRLCVKGNWNSTASQRGDTCQRDSGSGIYGFLANTGRQHCFGVVSEGGFCGSYDAYSNNTYVANYIDWITSNVRGDFLCAK